MRGVQYNLKRRIKLHYFFMTLGTIDIFNVQIVDPNIQYDRYIKMYLQIKMNIFFIFYYLLR
jgi:hypothetical protein